MFSGSSLVYLSGPGESGYDALWLEFLFTSSYGHHSSFTLSVPIRRDGTSSLPISVPDHSLPVTPMHSSTSDSVLKHDNLKKKFG